MHVAVLFRVIVLFIFLNLSFFLIREETEIIEGEVVEIQIDRPASGTVGQQLNYIHKTIYP